MMRPPRPAPGQGWVDIAVMCLTVAATVAAAVAVLALSSTGMDLRRYAAVWRPDGALLGRAEARPAPAATPLATGLDPALLAGPWRDAAGAAQMIVTAHGDVWSERGAMLGRVLPAGPGMNFVFGDTRFFCAYRVDIRSETTAAWQLVGQSPGTPCPQGALRRPPLF